MENMAENQKQAARNITAPLALCLGLDPEAVHTMATTGATPVATLQELLYMAQRVADFKEGVERRTRGGVLFMQAAVEAEKELTAGQGIPTAAHLAAVCRERALKYSVDPRAVTRFVECHICHTKPIPRCVANQTNQTGVGVDNTVALRKVLVALKAAYPEYADDIVMTTRSGGAVVWEGGPYNWAYRVAKGGGICHGEEQPAMLEELSRYLDNAGVRLKSDTAYSLVVVTNGE